MLRLIFALLAATPAAAQETAAAQPPVIVMTGDAVVRRVPDRALVTVIVETRASNPRDAQRRNADAMSAVQKRIADARVPKDAVRTLGYDLEQAFDFVDGRRVPRDFVARHSLEVRLDEVGRAGELVDIVVQAGATSIGGIQFDLQDRAAAEREALRLAVTDARARADAAAAGAGRTVDRVLRIEDARQEPPTMPRPMMALGRAAAAETETPVAPGLIEIHARITLTASMK